MTAYYNEIDAYAAQWLRNLIQDGQIAAGDVDERDIRDVRADDLRGYTQAHFFAGIGGWSVALRLAGWPDDRPVWTGSCPCQPFSAAGAGKAADDERHLWPAWFPLIAQRRPAIILGEQVEAAIGWGWLDVVFDDLEAQGYACGATILPACSVGAPHIRQRLWFVADANGGGEQRQQPQDSGAMRVAHSEYGRHGTLRDSAGGIGESVGSGAHDFLADTERDGGRADEPQRQEKGRTADGRSGAWQQIEWLRCTDGKFRPIEPGSFPLAHGVLRRTSKLRAYGNAIVPPVAAEFIAAVMD